MPLLDNVLLIASIDDLENFIREQAKINGYEVDKTALDNKRIKLVLKTIAKNPHNSENQFYVNFGDAVLTKVSKNKTRITTTFKL